MNDRKTDSKSVLVSNGPQDFRKLNPVDMGITPIDQDSPIPLYQQVRIDLTNLIRSGRLVPGDMLPSEDQLCEAYGVGRQTLRKAVTRLVNRNILDRTPGRGTVVLKHQDRQKFFLDRSFARQITEMGLKPSSEVLRKEQRVIDETSPESLRVKLDSSALELFRIRYGNGDPICVQYTTIVTDLCPTLYKHDFSVSSLYDLLLTEYRLPVTRIDHSVRASIADEWMRSLLKINSPAALLVVKTTAYLAEGDPIEASTSYYRADRYEFSTSQNF